jgi:rubrerythrin
LGTRAYVCQVCNLYDPSKNNRRFSDLYEESQKIAEQKIKEKQIELEEFELAAIKREEGIDLSIDEFEEVDEVSPSKFEKRKAGLEAVDDFQGVECPFCGEVFSDLPSHIRDCDLAPDDASVEDLIPQKKKKKKKPSKKKGTGEKGETEKQKCPYCGKEFQRLGRHLNSCPKKPVETEDK